MNSQRIVILGGTGFIGSHLLPRLAEDGHELKVLSRNRAKHPRLAIPPRTQVVDADVYDRAELTRHMDGATTVFNLVGILNEGRGQTFERVHVELTRRIIAAAADAGISRLHQMSALKAGQGRSAYLRSRGQAEALVKQSGLNWTIYEASTVFGHGDGLVSRFAGLLRLAPVLPLPRPQAKMAPVYVGDVVEAFARSIADPQLSQGRTLQLFGPDSYALIDIVRMIRDAAGLHRLVIGMPDAVGLIQAAVAGLLPGKPFTLDNFRSLLTDSVGTESGLAALGIQPHAFAPMLPKLLHELGDSRPDDHTPAGHTH